MIGLCETKEDGKGLENFRTGMRGGGGGGRGVVYETGKSEDNPNALLINKKLH